MSERVLGRTLSGFLFLLQDLVYVIGGTSFQGSMLKAWRGAAHVRVAPSLRQRVCV